VELSGRDRDFVWGGGLEKGVKMAHMFLVASALEFQGGWGEAAQSVDDTD
jgi:hypothetical protein